MKSFAKIILTAATAATMLSAPAYAIDYYDIQISRPEDLSMSCSEISQEVRLMEEIIRRSKETQEDAAMTSTGIGAAKTVASYLVGSLGGAIGIMAASYIVSEATDDRAETAESWQDLAEQRRSFMVGVYNARSCFGPLELATLEPAAGEEDEGWQPNTETSYHYND